MLGILMVFHFTIEAWANGFQLQQVLSFVKTGSPNKHYFMASFQVILVTENSSNSHILQTLPPASKCPSLSASNIYPHRTETPKLSGCLLLKPREMSISRTAVFRARISKKIAAAVASGDAKLRYRLANLWWPHLLGGSTPRCMVCKLNILPKLISELRLFLRNPYTFVTNDKLTSCNIPPEPRKQPGLTFYTGCLIGI